VKKFTRYAPTSKIPELSIVIVLDKEESYESISQALDCLQRSYVLLETEIVVVVDSIDPEIEGLILRLGSERSLSILKVDPSSSVAERRLAGYHYSFGTSPLLLFTSTKIRFDVENMDWIQSLVDEIISKESIWEVSPRGCVTEIQLYRREALYARAYGMLGYGETLESEVLASNVWFLGRGYEVRVINAAIRLEE
jgi:hypothetical protein